VLRDIDLELVAGELAWLTGDNGAGKTTLLRIVAGLITPNSGRGQRMRPRVAGLASRLPAAHRPADGR
jgi:ABC-type sulfate/molybdate transport systems ATPase subunit